METKLLYTSTEDRKFIALTPRNEGVIKYQDLWSLVSDRPEEECNSTAVPLKLRV